MFEYTKYRIRYQNTFELAISNIMFEVVRLVFHQEGIYKCPLSFSSTIMMLHAFFYKNHTRSKYI